jgi:hypothetical protein
MKSSSMSKIAKNKPRQAAPGKVATLRFGHQSLAGLKPHPRNPRTVPRLTDELIESGADLSPYLRNARVVPALLDPQKVNVDFPGWVVAALDREAARLGVPRQSLIKVWIVERLERAPVTA